MTSAQLRPIPFAIPFDNRPITGDNADSFSLQKQDSPSQIRHPPSARQASTVFIEQRAQGAETSALDQLQTQVEATETGQQRTARQRLDFISPPETPGNVRTSIHAGVPDGSIMTSHALKPIQDRDATPPAAQAGIVGSQTEVKGASSIKISGSSSEEQPRLEIAEQEMALSAGTAESPPPHGEAASGADSDVDPSEARMLASGDARAESSTQAVPEQHIQSAPESTAMPAIAAGAGTGSLSGPVHGLDVGAQANLGATVIQSAMPGALYAGAESEEGSVATHRPSGAAQNREIISRAEAEASEAGLDDGQGASHAGAQNRDTATQTTAALKHAPTERRSEDRTGDVASASGAAPLPESIPQLSTTPQLDEQRTITAEVEARGAHAILPAAGEDPIEAAPPMPQQLLAERSTNTAQPFSLPMPPPVPLFKRQHFTSNPKAAMPGSPSPTELSAASDSGGVASFPLQEQIPLAGSEGQAETETLVGNGSPVRESHATDADLLALAEEVRRLEQEVAAAQGAAQQACVHADAARAEARSARAEAEEWREREADARSELAANRGAYTEVREEAEAAEEELQQLQDLHRALQEQMATSLQQAHAVEGGKMSMRLEKAERAIEQERATVRDLQRALAAARQASPTASPRKDGGQVRAALAAAQKELADTRAALEAQKLTNSGLQIRVTELLRAAKETEELRRTYEDLSSRSEAIQRREAHTRELEGVVENLRAQNNALHVTMERLLGTNSELGNKVNSQTVRISSLESAVAEARASRPAPPAASEPAGGVRFSDTELELLALAEYVKELEAALEKQRALSPSHQQSTPPISVSGPASSSKAVSGRTASDSTEADGAPSSQQVHTATQTPEGCADGEPILAKVAEPQSPAQLKKHRVTWWGYITGADKAEPVKSAS